MLATHVTAEEGGTWIPIEDWQARRPTSYVGKLVHSIAFDDGSIWDAHIGAWRSDPRTHPQSQKAAPGK